MFAIIRDLIRYNIEFAIGLAILLLLIGAVILSFFSPYPAADIYVVPPDMPPDAEFWLGTTSRGQDNFWQLVIALRNTLAFGLGARVRENKSLERGRSLSDHDRGKIVSVRRGGNRRGRS